MQFASIFIMLQIMSNPTAGSANKPQKVVVGNGSKSTVESSPQPLHDAPYNIRAVFVPDREYKSSLIGIMNGKIVFDLKVNGIATKALLDTGSSGTIINRALADRLSLGSSGVALSIKRLGNTRPVHTTRSNRVSIDIPGQVKIDTNCALMDLEDISRFVGADIGLVIGRDILMTSSIFINFDSKELVIKPSGYIEAGSPAVKAPISADGLINVLIGGHKIDALVATGYAGILKLNDNDLLRVGSSNASPTMGTSINMKIDVAGVTSDIPIDVHTKPTPAMTHSLIGLGFLHNMNLIFDFSKGQLFLVPRRMQNP